MGTTRRMTVLIFAVICIFSAWSGCSFAADAKEFTFINITDVHVPTYGSPIGQSLDEATLMPMLNQQHLQQMVNECLAMKPRPAFVMNSGDTGDAGWTTLLKLYQKLMQPLVTAGIPVYTAVGNHDLDYTGIAKEDLAELFDPLGPALIGRHGTRYSFDYGGCHFIVMNNRPVTGLIRFTPSDIEWMRKDLSAVKKTTRILAFMHANVPEDDTRRIVELLQPFAYPVIFQGHSHNQSTGKWGGVPVMVTGSLYGGSPKAGSYRVVTVQPDKIILQTRDFDKPAGVLDSLVTVIYQQPGPQVRIVEPKNDTLVSGNVTLKAAINPIVPGTMEYSITGFAKWTPMTGANGKWEATAPVPTAPGRHFLSFQFRGENGSIMWAHTVIKVPATAVREVWSKDLGTAVQGAPVIWQNLAIVPTAENGVYALRLDNGKEVWRRKVEQGQVLGKVISDGDVIYYGAGRTVVACAAKNGKLLWQKPLQGTILSDMTLGEGKLFVPAGEHSLYCLNTGKGNILWEYTTVKPIMMEASTDGQRVFFGSMDGFVRALDSATGKEIWKNQVSSMQDIYTSAPFWPPITAGGRVIICKSPAQKDEKNLIAFNASDGKVIWSRQIAAYPIRMALSPSKDRFYMTFTQSGRRGLQCLSVGDGSSLWSQATGVGMNAGIASGNLVLMRDDDDICCVDATAGAVQWTYRASIGPQGTYYGPGAFAVRDNLAIVGTMDGLVISLQW